MNKFYQDMIFVLPSGEEVSLLELIKFVRSKNITFGTDDLSKLRLRREIECFSVIDRSELWYNDLTDEQYYELKNWRQAWLDVTETKIIPEAPKWLNNKLEGDNIL